MEYEKSKSFAETSIVYNEFENFVDAIKCLSFLTCFYIIMFAILCACLYADLNAYYELIELRPELESPT